MGDEFICVADLIEWAANAHNGDREKAIKDILTALDDRDLIVYQPIESAIKPRIEKSIEPQFKRALQVELGRLQAFDDIPF